jgi:hypothetical protein
LLIAVCCPMGIYHYWVLPSGWSDYLAFSLHQRCWFLVEWAVCSLNKLYYAFILGAIHAFHFFFSSTLAFAGLFLHCIIFINVFRFWQRILIFSRQSGFILTFFVGISSQLLCVLPLFIISNFLVWAFLCAQR